MAEENKFKRVKYWYDEKMWDIRRVRNAVAMDWITEDEYKVITGEDYE